MVEVNHLTRAHSALGASSTERWMNCPASVGLIAKLKDAGVITKSSSAYADEGSSAHELAEKCLLTNKKAKDFVGTVEEKYNITVTDEMAEAVQIYVDYIRQQGEGKEVSIEERFQLVDIDPELFGTCDAAISEEFGTLEIVDYKHGRGIAVEAEENSQLMYYALGAAIGGDYMDFKVTVVQPRCPHPDGPIRSWSFSAERLEEFKKELKKAVEATRSTKPEFKITEKGCKFCDAKAHCPLQKSDMMEVAKSVFDDAPLDVDTLTAEEVTSILSKKEQIKDFLEAVESRAFHLLKAGKKVEGYKLVEGRKNRVWGDESQVIADYNGFFEDGELFTKKLKTPAQLEKLLGKEAMAKYTVTPAGDLTLAKASDKRKEILPSIEIFND